MKPSEFFEVLGYLAAPGRRCKLDVEVPITNAQSFKDKYAGLSGTEPMVDDHNFFLWPEGANKWGVELRIYFVANKVNIPSAILGMVVSPRFRPQSGTAHNCRINNNKFIWTLIEYGFILGDSQNAQRIRDRVPSEYISYFERGFSLL